MKELKGLSPNKVVLLNSGIVKKEFLDNSSLFRSYYGQNIYNLFQPKLVKKAKVDINKRIIYYNYIDGENKKYFSSSMINEINEFIDSSKNITVSKSKTIYFPNFSTTITDLYTFALTNHTVSSYFKYLDDAFNLTKTVNFITHSYNYIFNDSFLLHLDLHPNNIIWKNGNLSGIIDFDQAGLGPIKLDKTIFIIRYAAQFINSPKIMNQVIYYCLPLLHITKTDFIILSKIYISKIILEKIYYFHLTGNKNVIEGSDGFNHWKNVYSNCINL